jgi:hypothetical protein
VSVVLSCRRVGSFRREAGVDQAEVSRGRSTGRGSDGGWEGPNVKWDGGFGVARAGRGDRSHLADAGQRKKGRSSRGAPACCSPGARVNGALTAHLQSGRRAGPGIHNDTMAFGPSALCHAYPNLAHVPWANRPERHQHRAPYGKSRTALGAPGMTGHWFPPAGRSTRTASAIASRSRSALPEPATRRPPDN